MRLLEDIYPELPSRADKAHIPRRQDYSFEPYGIQNALVLFKPLAGKRTITISERKTKAVFAQQVKLLNELYPDAECIRLIMDNDGTHKLNACYEHFQAEEARAVTKRIDVHFIPKHAAGLNMVELELSIFARHCLKDARIPSPKVLRDLAEAYQSQRNEVDWTFKIPDAKDKLKRLYSEII